MFVFTVKIGKKEYEDFEDAFNGVDEGLISAMDSAASGIKAALASALREVAAKIAARHGEQWSGIPDGSQPNLFSKTGSGLRSVLESIEVMGGATIESIVGVISAGGLSWHEFGAEPKPKGKYMVIPLPAAMDSRGVPIYPSPRAWYNTFIRMSKRGNLIIFQKRGNSIVPLYLLKTDAPRPPRLGMSEALTEELGFFQARLIEQIDEAMGKWRM